MKKPFVLLITALTTLGVTASSIADVESLQSLRGDELTSMSAKPEKMKILSVGGGIERSFKEQPPMVPHTIDKYEINLKINGCMKCHSEATAEKENTKPTPESHFLDRDGNKLDKPSPRRYFCNQCHTVQLKGEPLVDNTFQGLE